MANLRKTAQPTSSLDARMRTVLGRARQAAGMSLQDLADSTGVSVSTLSRIESGERRLTVEVLEVLAEAMETSVASLVADAEEDDRLLLPTPEVAMSDGMHGVLLHTDGDGRQLLRITVPRRPHTGPGRTHPGREWFHVLRGRVRLRVGDREVVLEPGQTARFDCTLPHTFGGEDGEAEILSRFEPGAHRAHRHDR